MNDMKYGLMIWVMTVSIRSSSISIWDIVSPCRLVHRCSRRAIVHHSVVRGLHSFPFPLNLSLLSPCPLNLGLLSPRPLNLSLLSPPYNPNNPWMCPEGAQVELYHERCDPKVLMLSCEVSECSKPLPVVRHTPRGINHAPQEQGLILVHSRAQLKHILPDRGASRNCSGGV